jgi:hypothetical protein
MTAAIMAIVLVLAGFMLSRSRFVKEINSRRFMPFVYSAATVYFAVRGYGAVSSHVRFWPHLLLAAIFLAGAVSSTRASCLFKRSR